MAVSFIRTVIVYILLVFSIRIMGKRQLGELEPIELVAAILISNLASQPLADIGTPLIYGLVPVLTLLCCQVIISWLTVKDIRFRRAICGKPSILIDNGVIVQGEMRKNRLSIDELYVELRRCGVTDIASIKHAILETDGSLSVIPYEKFSPVTPSQMGMNVTEPGEPVTVINDGRTITDNLRLLGLDEKWLDKELKGRKVASAKEVYLMTVNGAGEIFFVKKEGVK